MPLFVVTHTTPEGAHPLIIIDTVMPIYATLKALQAKHPGKFEGVGLIDPATAKQIPKRMIGRTLTPAEAKELMRRIG